MFFVPGATAKGMVGEEGGRRERWLCSWNTTPLRSSSGPHSVPRPLWVGLISPGRQNKLPGAREGMWLLQEEGAPGLPPVSSAPGLNVPGDQEAKMKGLLNSSRTILA